MSRTTLLTLACIATWAVSLSPLRVAAQSSDDTEASRTAIDELLTRFRSAAENADATAFFDCLAKDGVFFGTDAKEQFNYESLRAFLDPYFSKGIGWKRDVKTRHIVVGPNNQLGWFAETSQRANVGAMRSTGVVWKTDDGWKIVQSHVSILVPNEAVKEIAAVIRKWEAAESPSPDAQALSDEQREQVEASFEYVWQKIRDSYWDPNLGGVDWQAAYNELQPKLQEVKTHTDAVRLLSQLVARMEVSHFSIIPKSAYSELGRSDEKGARNGTTGIDVRIVDDQVLVVSVTPDSPAAKAGVRTGWVVEVIDDTEIPAKLAEVRKEFAGNPHDRVILASAANSRLRGRVGDELSVTFRDGDDELQEHTLELVPRRGKRVRFGHLPEFHVWVDVRSLDEGVGYFRFNAFMDPIQVMTAYNEFMSENLDAKGIIIDVRGNGGGNGDIAMGMIGWLMPGERAPIGRVILRDNELTLKVRPRPVTYAGPLVLLIDEMSVSAAEFFASGIKNLTNAQLVGTRTAGAVLGSQIERLPTGDGFQFAAANFISIRTGETLEGVGVAPHQVVEPDRDMLLAGKDSAIETAIAWIRTQQE